MRIEALDGFCALERPEFNLICKGRVHTCSLILCVAGRIVRPYRAAQSPLAIKLTNLYFSGFLSENNKGKEDKMELRVIVVQEDDCWTAQCVDYDIGTSGSTLEEMQRRMTLQLEAEARLSLESTGELFGGIPAAPAIFLQKWDECGGNSFGAHNQVRNDVSVMSKVCA